MRALSIRQPWAWLIVRPDLSGEARTAWVDSPQRKDIENRDWSTDFRGRVLVHAGLTMPLSYYEEVQQWVGTDFNIQLPEPEQLQRGGIVGVVTIADCVRESASRWFQGEFGFVLRDARPLPFVPFKGRLQFFDVPAAAVGMSPGGGTA